MLFHKYPHNILVGNHKHKENEERKANSIAGICNRRSDRTADDSFDEYKKQVEKHIANINKEKQ